TQSRVVGSKNCHRPIVVWISQYAAHMGRHDFRKKNAWTPRRLQRNIGWQCPLRVWFKYTVWMIDETTGSSGDGESFLCIILRVGFKDISKDCFAARSPDIVQTTQVFFDIVWLVYKIRYIPPSLASSCLISIHKVYRRVIPMKILFVCAGNTCRSPM